MGLTFATIEVIAAGDSGMARRKLMPEDPIRRSEVRMLVDTGARMLCLNEHLRAQLGLDIVDSMEDELTDGSVVKMPLAGPVDLKSGNRQTFCRAVIPPGDAQPLPGAIPWRTWMC